MALRSEIESSGITAATFADNRLCLTLFQWLIAVIQIFTPMDIRIRMHEMEMKELKAMSDGAESRLRALMERQSALNTRLVQTEQAVADAEHDAKLAKLRLDRARMIHTGASAEEMS